MTCPRHDWRVHPEHGGYYCGACGMDGDVTEKVLLCSACLTLPARWGGTCDPCEYKAELERGTEDDRWFARFDAWCA